MNTEIIKNNDLIMTKELKKSDVNHDLVRQLIKTLRGRIVAWEYPPHFQLVEENLAQEFGVSRSPIRQALTYLAAEGLVIQLPRKGFRVQQMQLRDVEELYEFRLALEMQIVHGLAHKGLNQNDLCRLQLIWQDSQLLEKKSIAELASLDEDFHTSLALAYGNSIITKNLNSINERLFSFREIDFAKNTRLDSTCHEHSQILHFIISHNPEKACELIKQNINSGLGNVENSIIQLVGKSFLNK